MKRALGIVILCFSIWPLFATQAQTPELPCYYRPTSLDKPWIGQDIPCIEEVINLPEAGELAFTSLAVSPDNRLFAARPRSGQVMLLTDGDDDGLPETVETYAEGLDRPNSLAFYEGSLYVAGRNHLYRISESQVETLVDSLPGNAGDWVGGIAVGIVGDSAEPRIYVAIGAPCDDCVYDSSERAVILSYALDGSDRQLVATGLRQPSDLAIHNGELWVVDSAPQGLTGDAMADELNRVTAGADFGFPTCVGMGTALVENGCDGKVSPAVVFSTGSQPLGLVFYDSDVLESMTGDVLLAMGGTFNQLDLGGYQLAAVSGIETGSPSVRTLIPDSSSNDPAIASLTPSTLNWRGVGFYPARPYDVVVNDWGWVYISLGGGRILSLRPQSENVY